MPVLSKAIVVLFLILILFSLGSGLYYLLMDEPKSARIVKALSWRIGLSLFLFILLFIAFALGLIQPHSLAGG